ncbi:MAG: fructose-1,6-bisphosphatase [Proteobacteria bacterium]|nr:fructose-1,6-bisphosphatase [Pseudomonadota bacterium]
MSERPFQHPTLHESLRSAADRGEALGDVIESIAQACREIAGRVRRARLQDILGDAGSRNVHGEDQQKLDALSNELLLDHLARCPAVGVCASEEEEEAVVVRARGDGGEFCVAYDPLDGSSNIDVAVNVGTIFSVLPNDLDPASPLQRGERQLAAGYVVYGSSVLMVLSLGDGVDLYVLDPDLNEFVRVEERLRMPDRKRVYSLNEAYRDDFPEGYRNYLDYAHANGYSSRYIGSMVGDVHRTLLKGGVFLYPPTSAAPSGKLRLLYEGNPMSLLIEQAGGTADTGSGRILEVEPGELHQRTPVVLGSREEVAHVLERL